MNDVSIDGNWERCGLSARDHDGSSGLANNRDKILQQRDVRGVDSGLFTRTL
jgi:hypothetical protein